MSSQGGASRDRLAQGGSGTRTRGGGAWPELRNPHRRRGRRRGEKGKRGGRRRSKREEMDC